MLIRSAVRGAVAGVVAALAVGHILFGLANFQPGFPVVEGIAAVIGGSSLLASIVVGTRSVGRALWIACIGTLPLAAWFAYAVPVERSSDPIFLALSLVVPTVAGMLALLRERSR